MKIEVLVHILQVQNVMMQARIFKGSAVDFLLHHSCHVNITH
jgi:hypothetical protein